MTVLGYDMHVMLIVSIYGSLNDVLYALLIARLCLSCYFEETGIVLSVAAGIILDHRVVICIAAKETTVLSQLPLASTDTFFIGEPFSHIPQLYNFVISI